MAKKAREEKSESAPRSRVTLLIPTELLEEMRDAVVHLSGPPDRLTLARFVEEACRRELARLRSKHTGGKAFPRRTAELRAGRPIGS